MTWKRVEIKQASWQELGFMYKALIVIYLKALLIAYAHLYELIVEHTNWYRHIVLGGASIGMALLYHKFAAIIWALRQSLGHGRHY